MKVTFVHNFDPLDSSAISANILDLAIGFVKNGFNCEIVSPNAEDAGTFKGVTIKKPADFDQLAEVVAATDVIFPIINFTSIPKPIGIAVAGLCDRLKKPFFPLVCTTVLVSWFNNYKGISDFEQSLNLGLMQAAFNSPMCKKIVCVSNAVKISLLNLGVNPDKPVVIFNGINFDKPAFTDITPVEKEFDVIFVGRLSKEKGISSFLSIMKLVKDKIPNIKICIVGNGTEEDLAKSLVKVFGLQDNVKMIPKLENGHLLAQLKKAKVLVSTSLTESFGLAIVEAMALGVAVVAPDIEGPLEITNNGKCAFLFKSCDTGDAAVKILKCINLTVPNKKLIEAQQFALRNFSSLVQLDEFLKLITITRS